MRKNWVMFVWLCAVCTRLPSADGILPDVATLCPYNNFCHSNATMRQNPEEMHLTPCCQKCSCDPFCQRIGKCCPDMKMKPDIEQKYPCVILSEYLNDPRDIVSSSGGNQLSYRIIDSCPDAKLDIAFPRCSNLRMLEDYVLVTDPATDLLYMNKHCASCNEVTTENLIEWDLITDCNPYSGYPTIEEWHEYVMTNCSLIPHPPDPSVGQLVKCHPRGVLSRCNITKNWDVFDIDVKNACEVEDTNTNNIYTLEFRRTRYFNMYFKNVYCFLCNTRQDEVLPGLCEPQVINLPRSFGMTIFINYKKQPTEDTIKTDRCGSSQIWNQFNGSCLTVRCPVGTYVYKGKCEYIYRTLPRPAYTIMFRLKTNDDVYSVELDTFLKGVVTSMLANTDCFHCETCIQYDGISTYFLTHELMSQLSCDEEFIISKMKQFLNSSPIRLRFQNRTQIVMVPELSLIDVQYIRLQSSRNGHCTQMPIVITWAMIDKCPRIPISSLDIDVFNTSITTERNGTICVDEYFRIMASKDDCDILLSCKAYMIAVIACVFIMLHFV